MLSEKTSSNICQDMLSENTALIVCKDILNEKCFDYMQGHAK